jgi:hypothetical protein
MVVGGDFSATGLARPVCIEVAVNSVFVQIDCYADPVMKICAIPATKCRSVRGSYAHNSLLHDDGLL